jgi:hypothetical protein
MEVSYAFLARSGEFAPDGTFSVFGGDFSTIQGKTFPLLMPSMSLIAKLVFAKEESGQHHAINVDVVGEDNVNLAPPAKQEFDIPAPQDPEKKMAVSLGVVLNGLQFPRPGNYRVRLLWDGQELRTIKLELVELTESGPAAVATKQVR